MIRQIYSVRDAQAAIYGPPVLALTDGEAIRSFQTAANNPQSAIGQHPADYDLFHLGTFDDETGKYQSLEAPKRLIKALDLKS